MRFAIRSVTQPGFTLFVSALTLALAACGAREVPPDEDVAMLDPNIPIALVNTGFSIPESALWDSVRSVWYVSNINATAAAPNEPGYVIRLGPDGAKLDTLPFISGGDDDITLNSPKGLALQGDTLWVADVTVLRGFSVTSGTMVATVDLGPLQATFLNDVAVSEDGTIYITDSGMAFDAQGTMTHPGKSRVFSVRNGVASEAVVLPRQSAANGIAWDATRGAWIIVAFNSPDIYSWSPGSKSATVIGSGPGGADGVVVLADGRAIYSSWADSSLTLFANGISTTIRKGLPSPADIGYDPVRKVVAVPLFNEYRVELWIADPPMS